MKRVNYGCCKNEWVPIVVVALNCFIWLNLDWENFIIIVINISFMYIYLIKELIP